MDGLRELDRIGSLIAGKYRLESILGRGGMGTVYRATHTWTSRPVAVKCLHQEYAHDAQSVGRFLREARAASAVRHPNAVDVLDMGQDQDGSAYLVLEYLEGDTLAGHLERFGKLSPEDTVRYLAPVFEALAELHNAGVVHRDLKPANIFLARSARGVITPKLLDFGVAKVLEAQSSLVTTTGIVVGTPAYMAPEQAAGNGNIGPWTDIWAAGTVLFECLTGDLPFMAPTPSLMLVDVMTKTAPPLASKRPDLDPNLCAVVDRTLAKDPRDRFASLTDLVMALCRALGLEAPPGPTVSVSVRPPSPFAVTENAMVTPARAHAPTLSATPGDAKALVEPAATGPTTTARTRAPRKRTYWATGIALAVLALGGVAFQLRDAKQPAQDRPSPPAGNVPAATAPIAPTPAPTKSEPVAPPVEAPSVSLTPVAPEQPAVVEPTNEPPARSKARDKFRKDKRVAARDQAAPPAQPQPEKKAEGPRAPTVERVW